MCKHEEKQCPRCTIVFECKRGSILQCQCSCIQLPEAVAAYIENEYNDCLCLTCLRQINENQANKS